jgi:hypothetical protein
MNKNQKPNHQKVVPLQEKDLRFAKGAEEKQHVDNPG